MKRPDSSYRALPRREFMRNAAAATAAFTILPRHVLGKSKRIAPSDRVNIAAVGVGGMGRANLQALSSQNIVALCDVDWRFADSRFADIPKQLDQARERLAQASDDTQRQRAQGQIDGWLKLQPQLPKAKRYTDFREMLEQQKNID